MWSLGDRLPPILVHAAMPPVTSQAAPQEPGAGVEPAPPRRVDEVSFRYSSPAYFFFASVPTNGVIYPGGSGGGGGGSPTGV